MTFIGFDPRFQPNITGQRDWSQFTFNCNFQFTFFRNLADVFILSLQATTTLYITKQVVIGFHCLNQFCVWSFSSTTLLLFLIAMKRCAASTHQASKKKKRKHHPWVWNEEMDWKNRERMLWKKKIIVMTKRSHWGAKYYFSKKHSAVSIQKSNHSVSKRSASSNCQNNSGASIFSAFDNMPSNSFSRASGFIQQPAAQSLAAAYCVASKEQIK